MYILLFHSGANNCWALEPRWNRDKEEHERRESSFDKGVSFLEPHRVHFESFKRTSTDTQSTGVIKTRDSLHYVNSSHQRGIHTILSSKFRRNQPLRQKRRVVTETSETAFSFRLVSSWRKRRVVRSLCIFWPNLCSSLTNLSWL